MCPLDNGVGSFPLGSNTPNTYNPNYNEYQQQVFTDDVKDLHYEHTHGGHTSEFTVTNSHPGGGQQQSSGSGNNQSGSSGGSSGGSGFGHGIGHGGSGGGGHNPLMSGR